MAERELFAADDAGPNPVVLSAPSKRGPSARAHLPSSSPGKLGFIDRITAAIGGLHKLVGALVGLLLAISAGIAAVQGAFTKKPSPPVSQQESAGQKQKAPEESGHPIRPECDPKLGDSRPISCNPE